MLGFRAGLKRRASQPSPAKSGRGGSADRDALFRFPGEVGRVGEPNGLETILAVGARLLALGCRRNEGREFVAIRGRIALEEEIERLVAREPLRARELDARLADIVGADHALRAMRLDALIVAIGGAARIRDLRDLARFGLHDDDGGVDVARLADRLVDQSRTHRADRDRLLAEQEARHVEIVDHHVAKQTARARYIGNWRRAGVPRGARNHLELADQTVGDPSPERCEIMVEPAIEPYHQPGAGRLDDIDALADAVGVEIN